jgi:hypothetical protein
VKPAYLAVGLVLTLVGGYFLFFAEEIWRLYHNGPETCSPAYSPVDNGPTCASIDAMIYELAIIGIILFVGSGVVFFFGRGKATQNLLGKSPNNDSVL